METYPQLILYVLRFLTEGLGSMAGHGMGMLVYSEHNSDIFLSSPVSCLSSQAEEEIP